MTVPNSESVLAVQHNNAASRR